MAPTSTDPLRAAAEPSDVMTVIPPLIWSTAWSGTSDHVGPVLTCVVTSVVPPTSWSLPFESPAPTAAEEVARLRDRILEATGLSRQDIARGIGVDRRSLSGLATGEIRPTEARLRALQVLADAAEWAAARYGARAKDVLRTDAGKGAALDLIAEGHTSVISEMEEAAMGLGLVRRGSVSVRARKTSREPLYLKAREAWADRVDKPAAGGRVQDPAAYEQDLSRAKPAPRSTRPRRRDI
jgi:transcriptional regulator with XRE-family HTH domain